MIYAITDKRVFDMALPLEELTRRPELQPGVKNSNGIESTWCNHYLYEAAVMFGFDVRPLLNPKGIGWTSANDIFRNARKSELAGKVSFLLEHEAQYLANDGHIVAVIAYNMSGTKSSGHCAVVKPYCGEFNYQSGCMIIQAGAKNGTYRRQECFDFAELTPPVFVKLNKLVA